MNCGEDCQSALSGARPMVRSVSTADEAVVAAIHNVFGELCPDGSARRVWLWFRSEGLTFPLQMHQGAEIRWVEASYTAIHHVLTIPPTPAPTLAANHVGRRCWMHRASAKSVCSKTRLCSEWQVLIPDHHRGFIDWQTYEANQDRIAQNTRPGPHKAGGAREGSALLQGLATCGALRTPLAHALSRTPLLAGVSLPGQGSGRGPRRLLPQYRRHPDRRGRHPDLHRRPGAGRACRHSRRRRTARGRSRDLAQAMDVPASSEQATKPAAPSAAIAPSIPTTAWSLAVSKREWEERLERVEAAKAELRREEARPRALSQMSTARLLALGAGTWPPFGIPQPRRSADRKELLRALLAGSHCSRSSADRCHEAPLPSAGGAARSS